MSNAIARRPSGLDLHFERKAAGLTQDQLAVTLGVTRQRIAAIEGARFPSLKATERYLAAVASVAPARTGAGDVDVETIRVPVCDALHSKGPRKGSIVIFHSNMQSVGGAQVVIELTAEGYVLLGDEAAVGLAEARAAVLEVLPATDGLRFNEIPAETGARRSTLQVALAELIGAEAVERADKGRRGIVPRPAA